MIRKFGEYEIVQAMSYTSERPRPFEAFVLFALLLTVTWEGVLFLTTQSGTNLRPYFLFLVLLVLILLVKRRVIVDVSSLLVGLYFFTALPGLLNSGAPSDTLGVLLFVALMVVMALAIRSTLDTPRRRNRAVIVWTLVVGNIASVFGMLQFITWAIGVPISPQFVPVLYPLYRPYSVFHEPNTYASFLASQNVMLLVLWLSPTHKHLHTWLGFSLLGGIVLLALNQSRGAWLGFVFSLIVFVFLYFLVRARFSKKLLIWSFVLVYGLMGCAPAAFLLAPELGTSFGQRLVSLVDPQSEGAADERIDDIVRAIALISRHPIVGHGVGTWGLYDGKFGREIRTPPRNVFVAWFFERGIVGCAAGTAIILLLLRRVRSALRVTDRDQSTLVWACFAGWLTTFITFQATYIDISPPYWVQVGLLLSVTDTGIRTRGADNQSGALYSASNYAGTTSSF